jgi:Flp pilus assembly protein TadG
MRGITKFARWLGFGNPLLRRLLPDPNGATIIEAAIILPVYFLVLFGVFEYAIVLSGWAGATYGARQAARYASIHSPTSLAPCGSASSAGCPQETALIQPFIWGAANNGLTVNTKWVGTTTNGAIGTWVVVNVTVQYHLIIPYSKLTAITVGNQAQYPITR